MLGVVVINVILAIQPFQLLNANHVVIQLIEIQPIIVIVMMDFLIMMNKPAQNVFFLVVIVLPYLFVLHAKFKLIDHQQLQLVNVIKGFIIIKMMNVNNVTIIVKNVPYHPQIVQFAKSKKEEMILFLTVLVKKGISKILFRKIVFSVLIIVNLVQIVVVIVLHVLMIDLLQIQLIQLVDVLIQVSKILMDHVLLVKVLVCNVVI